FTSFVGSAVVSAITHTPASGPFALVTTPPRSSSSMRTASAPCWRAAGDADAMASTTPMPTAAALEYTSRMIFIRTPVAEILPRLRVAWSFDRNTLLHLVEPVEHDFYRGLRQITLTADSNADERAVRHQVERPWAGRPSVEYGP